MLGTEKEWVTRALDETFIGGTSPIVSQFEKSFAEFRGVPHAVAVSNGTAALHVALLALGIGPGDEVIVPDMTIISDAVGVVLCGATPVFIDVSPNDYCLDVKKIEAAITSRTKAILAVHMYGNACDMDFLQKIAAEKRILLVEDTAQAMDSRWKEKELGTFGAAATYSFYPNKLITTGEGGAVTCQDSAIASKAKVITNLGFDPDPDRRFIHAYFSNNYRLSGLQAAMGMAQLEGIEKLKKMRRRVREMYVEALTPMKGISLAKPDPRSTPSFWMQTVVLDDDAKISVSELGRQLAEKGIETRRFFYPLHLQPVLEPYHQQQDDTFSVSERLFDKGLYLPSSPHLTWDQIQEVVKQLSRCLT